MDVPEDQTWLFWDVDPAAIELERDARYVLGRVLERGRMVDVQWVVGRYGLERIRAFFRAGAHPEVSLRTWTFWRVFLNEEDEPWLENQEFPRRSNSHWAS